MNLVSLVTSFAPYFLWILGALIIAAFGVVKPYLALGIFGIALVLSIFCAVDWSPVALNFPMLVASVGILFTVIGLLVALVASCFGYSFRLVDLPRLRM